MKQCHNTGMIGTVDDINRKGCDMTAARQKAAAELAMFAQQFSLRAKNDACLRIAFAELENELSERAQRSSGDVETQPIQKLQQQPQAKST